MEDPQIEARGRWLGDHGLASAAAVWIALGIALIPLARGLPARAFFVGDPGVKLIAARNAIDHPTHPLDITLPTIAGHPVEFVDQFFRVHGDHAHASTPEVFPLVSAPLLAMFGIRGIMILPAAGFLLMIASTAWLGVALDAGRSPLIVMLVAAICTPVLFYGLEFWEHAPVAGLAAAGTALVVTLPRSRARLALAGVVFGLAILLRPEAGCYCGALLVCAPLWPGRLRKGDVPTILGAAAAVLVPPLAFSTVHGGRVIGGHMAVNLSNLASNWIPARIAIARVWFAPPGRILGLLCGLTAGLALAPNFISSNRVAGTTRVLAGLCAAAVAVAAALRMFPVANMVGAAPAALLAVGVWDTPKKSGRLFLLAVALLSSVLVFLTAPTDGGGEWSPRYLLLAFIPLAVLTSDALHMTFTRSVLGAAVTIVIVAASVGVQRRAYKELRDAKRTYERIVTFVERGTAPGSYIVTDLWWLDEVTAALYPTRVWLLVKSPASAQRVLALLAEADISNVSLVRSRNESPADTFEHWRGDLPFVVYRTLEIPDRELTLYQLRARHPARLLKR
jgi:hypothetical protein